MEKAHCLDSEESRWWALKFCFKFFQPICPRRPLDLECTSVSGDLHPHSTLASSATPPSLWPGRELRKFHYFVRGNDIQFSRYGFQLWGSPRLGCCPLAVTIVYLKTECFFRMHSFRFLDFFSPKKQQNRKLSFRFHIDTFDFFATKKEAGERSPTSHRFIIRSQSPLQMPEAVRQMIL